MQDLAASAVVKELNVEKLECDMHQVCKVGTSSIGELARSKDNSKLHAHSSCLHFAMLMLKLH